MKIHVGSKNKTKIQAVQDALELYPKLFPKPVIVSIDVDVPEFGHPKNIKETVEGARERAKKAFTDCDYSFGLEGGLMEVPFTDSGFMETGACVIFDGKRFHLGLAPSFEWPKKVTDLILRGKADASQAFKQLGLTHYEKLGVVSGGVIGVLTEGKITRENFIKYSIIMALTRLNKPEYFK
jgi:inosine/xanthosine triphosphatase